VSKSLQLSRMRVLRVQCAYDLALPEVNMGDEAASAHRISLTDLQRSAMVQVR
jgi:hypothetical protein